MDSDDTLPGFEELVAITVPVVEGALRALTPDLTWTHQPCPPGEVVRVLLGRQGAQVLRFHLEVLPVLDRAHAVLAVARATSRLAEAREFGDREGHSTLLVARRLQEREHVDAAVEEFNRRFQRAGGGVATAFLGYLGVEDDHVRVPGVEAPAPPLEQLDLSPAGLSAPPPRPASEPPPPGSAPPGSGRVRLPQLSLPPRPPEPEYDEIVEDLASLVVRELQALDAGTRWTPEPQREPYFDEVLLGTKDLARYRFSLKVMETLTPAALTEVLEYARVLVNIFSTSRVSEQHAYLLVGRSVRDVAPLYQQLEDFNRVLWTPANPFASRAYVAYLPGLAGAVGVPGVDRPDPPLQRLRLVDHDAGVDRPSILVVDDDPLAVTILADTLTEAGYAVVTASEWSGFRDAVMGSALAAVILDVNMPNLTGDKMAMFVNRFAEAPRPRILLHSGIEEATLAALAHSVSAAGYLCKGGSERQILATVEAAVLEFAEERARLEG